MPDMLVKLYALPALAPAIQQQQDHGILIRRGLVPEKSLVTKWVGEHFGEYWVNETDIAFTQQPVACFLALDENGLIGFGCYNATFKGFFGPTGVSEAGRGKGTGKALLLACLHAMYAEGYMYGIIGGVGPAEFYAKAVGATLIEDSTPGPYARLLPQPTE